jgi:Cu/Ag efflux pump CusA
VFGQREACRAVLPSGFPAALDDVDTIQSTLVTTPSGADIPLHALTAVRRDRGPNTVSRENVQRKIVVMCNVGGRDLRSVVEDIRRRVEAAVPLPRGYHAEYGGQFESAEEASRTPLVLGALVIVGISLLLFVALGSARDTGLVLVNLPLALIGGVAGVFLAGGVLSVASLIGFITLFGIATRNGLVMISHVNNLIEWEIETDVIAAVKRGAMERLSPILMTALAAGLALIPLALAAGEPGSEIQAPMAVVILCGLLSSTALNSSSSRRCTCASAPSGEADCRWWRTTDRRHDGPADRHDQRARLGHALRPECSAGEAALPGTGPCCSRASCTSARVSASPPSRH